MKPLARSSGPTLGLVTAALFLPGAIFGQDRSVFSVLDTQGRSVGVSMSADGDLSPGDVLSAGGRRVQVWALAAAPGAALQVDLRSADFDAFLYVVGPGLGEGLRDDDGGDGLNSRICVALSEVGEYRLVASSLSGETGAFTLEVSDMPGATNGACPAEPVEEEITDLAELDTGGRTLAIGSEVDGTLGANDPVVFAAPAQAWALEGRAGESLSVDLVSEDFDSYLMVEGPGLESWLMDDDGAGRCDSRLTFTFPQTGTYRVVASTLGTSGGSFRLLVGSEAGPVNPDGCFAPVYEEEGEEDDLSVSAEEVGEVGTVAYGTPADGAMTGNEDIFQGRFVQGWTLSASAGDQVALELRSADFDSYLYFLGPGFPDPLWDDDGAGNLHSRICVEIPENGEYQVLAGPLSGDEAGGRYTLTATRAEGGGGTLCDTFEVSPAIVTARLARLPTDGRSLSVGSEQLGQLDLSAVRHPDTDQLIQAWSLTVPGGQTVFVDVVSEEFDPLLYAVGPGVDLYNDDFGGAEGCNTRLEIGPDVSGPLTLLVGSFYQQASGAFLVRASTDPPALEPGGCVGSDAGSTGGTSSDPSTLVALSSGEDRPITIGTEALGTLGAFEEALAAGQPAQTWSLMVEAGDELIIELISDDFDPILYLDGPGLFTPLMDDDGAGELNSRIEYTAPESGRMRVAVTAISAEGSGDFRLRVLRRAR